MEWTFTIAELPEVAQSFWAAYGGQQIFTLTGAMGAGKTTFVKALCAAKGVEDTTASPTFSIINQYTYRTNDGATRNIYHLDLYRLRDEEEAIGAGVEDTLYQDGAICFVEWPDIIENLLPEDTIRLQLTVLPDQRRQLRVG
ncbi:tRNA (adenosine(37)-N6)-threonylcarbamoyltransferase complex ATPase subunit type 1 TsaE [Chitinophaga sp.]|uniref:tRNA (adenosine(37)-N6)-threonylcarbamoyltransferase complex ATPase subunit type 1 TsaE n=1 Tax=Chitinophaga sp. TaxID=1869181 RepID=UPI0031D2FDF4